MIDKFLKWLFAPKEPVDILEMIVEDISKFDSISNHGWSDIDVENGSFFVLIKKDRWTYKDKITIKFGRNVVWVNYDINDYPFFLFEQQEIDAIRKAIVELHNKEVTYER